DPDGLSSLCCWERVCNDGNVVGPDEGWTYSREEAEAYEHATVLGQTAESRADGEDREARVVEADLAVHVRQATEREQCYCGHEDVAHQDPERVQSGGAWKLPDDCGEG